MSKQTTDIVAYLTWVGLIIALVAGDRDASRARSGVTESAFRVRLTLMC